MSWAMRRRLIIFGILFAIVALIVGGTYYAFAHKPPTCTDHKQNQNEEGIDCGGSCTYLCTESRTKPSVQFVRALSPAPERTDVIAYIDNPNRDTAAHAVPYTIQLYSPDNSVVAEKSGVVDLPPESTVPLYIPDFFSGSQTVARAFLTFDPPTLYWFAYVDQSTRPKAENIRYVGGDTPRITATAVNRAATPLRNVTFVVTVFNDQGNAIGASQTVVTLLPAGGSAPLVFTWGAPFSGLVSRIEITPVTPVPTP